MSNDAATAPTNKKSRSPQIEQNAFLRAMVALRTSLQMAPTLHQITTFFNTHTWTSGEWVKNPDGVVGVRNSLSVGSRMSQLRSAIEDNEEISKEDIEVLLGILEVTGERKAVNYSSIVSDIKSLGLLRVPGNMVQGGSGAVPTNGQPVEGVMIETPEEVSY